MLERWNHCFWICMNTCMFVEMDGWIDGWTDIWINRYELKAWMSEWMNDRSVSQSVSQSVSLLEVCILTPLKFQPNKSLDVTKSSPVLQPWPRRRSSPMRSFMAMTPPRRSWSQPSHWAWSDSSETNTQDLSFWYSMWSMHLTEQWSKFTEIIN